MLDRSRQQPTLRQRRAANQRRYRAHVKHGVVCVSVEVDDQIIGLLCRLRWLPENQASDKREIGAAIARMVADAAK